MQGNPDRARDRGLGRRSRNWSILLFFLSVCLSAALAHSLLRERVRENSPYALYDVVSRQLEAIQSADFSSAYLQAARHVRGNIGLNEFTGLVNAHYHPLLEAQRVEFGSMHRSGHEAKLKVYLVNQREIVTPCVYHLVCENGKWKVSGVRLMRSWPKQYRLSGVRT